MTSKKINLAEFLRAKRHEAGLSQIDVSRCFRYHTPQFISNWERGVAVPPLTSLKKIAKLYKIDENILFEAFLEDSIRKVTEDLKRKFNSSSKR